jgi:glucokinase
MHTESFFLIGDIGGTNLRVELRDKSNTVIKKVVVKTADYKNMSEFLHAFFKDLDVKYHQVYGAISIASKILNNKVVTNANYNWELADGDAIKKEFGFREMILLNDFEACGYSLPLINQHEVVILKGTHVPELDKDKDHKVMLVGPGTGLGVCLLSHK